VHNDICPRNLLFSRGRFKLADLGLSKLLPDEESSYSFSSGGAPTGAGGWYAREILNGQRKTRSVDIFSLGCVFYYTLSHGIHPFGDKFYSYVNIKEGNYPSLVGISISQRHLIAQMLSHEPTERPDINQVSAHPMFWDTKQILLFLHNTSNIIDHENASCKSDFNQYCKIDSHSNWRKTLDTIVWNHISQYRIYVETNYIQLLRAIRNLQEHWKEIKYRNPDLYAFFGRRISGVWDYFDRKFPALLINVWNAMHKLNLMSKLEEE